MNVVGVLQEEEGDQHGGGLESEGGEWGQNYEGPYCYFKHLGIILSDNENLWRGLYLITVVVVCVCHEFDSFPLQSYIFRYAS